jgi:hypothetical protein
MFPVLVGVKSCQKQAEYVDGKGFGKFCFPDCPEMEPGGPWWICPYVGVNASSAAFDGGI